MITYNKETPILLVASGFPKTIRQIYNQLQRLEPHYLYVVFDAEQEQIQTIFNKIPWKCKLRTLQSKTPLEDDTVMLKAARWFFNQEPEGIVLDGSNVPYPAFFAFCSSMLEKYRNDERIGHISGWDFRYSKQKQKVTDSYYFSKLTHVYSGWASWSRVWKNISSDLKTFPAFRQRNLIEEIPSHKPFRYHWHYWNHLDNWDTKYEYANLINNRLSIVLYRQTLSFEYELPEIVHPKFILTPIHDELQLQEIKYRIPAVTLNDPDGLTFLQEKLFSFSKEAKQRMKIPRIIHQIYEDPAGPPDDLLSIAETWKEKMPDWEYRFWGKKEMEDFMENEFPDFLPTYRGYLFNVQRWDAIRYLILYKIGGLYVDLDYECIRPLDVLMSDSTCCMGMEPTVNSKFHNRKLIVGNALMASVSGHPYMKAIIEDMKSNSSAYLDRTDSGQVMETTGPFMTTRVYEELKKKKTVTLLPADWVAPLSIKEVWSLRTGHARENVLKKVEKAFALHYFFGSWTPQTTKGKFLEENNE
jgi:mannosyltransferase OCH1-like enzyme